MTKDESIARCGNFIISLDFELLWGVRDLHDEESYGKEILGVHQIFPEMLRLFRDYGVKATFATVGFLFAGSKEAIDRYTPDVLPDYENPNLSPYNGHIQKLEQAGELEDPYHFAPSLMKMLQQYPEQEIATHTFSHYYCLAPGQDADQFEADLEAAVAIASDSGLQLKSIVFPRNQCNADYLGICAKHGIKSYRGNENAWFYNTGRRGWLSTKLGRALRLADSYINISGQNCYQTPGATDNLPVNLPSSRFLRPYNPMLRLLEPFRLRRILQGMAFAAREGLTYHLWWHPHNFGANQIENLNFLEKILKSYKQLNTTHGFQSKTMCQLSEEINKAVGVNGL